MKYEDVMRELLMVWTDFSSRLDTTPMIDKLNRGKFRKQDYMDLLVNHRQQVVDGGRWIARAASNIDENHNDLRSLFIQHCATEHRDFKMLEQNYVSLGGKIEDIQNAQKNIGTEALSAFMFHKASQPNPFNLLGAMFIIEGLGQNKAGKWGRMICDTLNLSEDQVSFFLYHAENDEDHMQEFESVLKSGILDVKGMGEDIVKTAKITARLYCLQIEEIDNV